MDEVVAYGEERSFKGRSTSKPSYLFPSILREAHHFFLRNSSFKHQIMEKYELQKLRDLPIEGVAERLGLQVKRHKALCPFHDDHHASLSFHVRRNTFRCFVCGASGALLTW